MRIVNAELEYLVVEPRKEFITMVVLAVGNIPLLYFLNPSWYDTLMHGMVVDASSSKGKVVYRNLFDSDKQVMYGRPQ